MDTSTEAEDRLLSIPERDMVVQTRPPALDGMGKAGLQDLGKRLRAARDRSRRIASQQQREMRGKTDPRGMTPARENAGSEAKTAVLVEALKRVTAALRKVNRPSMTATLQQALDTKNATRSAHPGAGRTAAKGMRSAPSTEPTVRTDPRETGRVSQATKVAQAKRDR